MEENIKIFRSYRKKVRPRAVQNLNNNLRTSKRYQTESCQCYDYSINHYSRMIGPTGFRLAAYRHR